MPWIGWIPDFQHKYFPQIFQREELERRDRVYHKLIAQAPHLVVSREAALGDLQRWFSVPSGRVSVFPFHMIPDTHWYEGSPGTVSRKLKLPDKYLMFPSQFWVHKNHATLFKSIALVKQRGIRDIAVVCTGQQNDRRCPGHFDALTRDMRALGICENVYVTGLLARWDQVQLMRRAAAIVQPSLFEGWSALVEDARTLGKSLFLSDIPVHREQRPPDAVFFDAESAEDIAAKLQAAWPHLSPGPDPRREEAAWGETKKNGVRFARRFIEIVQNARI